MPPQQKKPPTSNVGDAPNAAGVGLGGWRSHSMQQVRRSFLILLLLRKAVGATVMAVGAIFAKTRLRAIDPRREENRPGQVG